MNQDVTIIPKPIIQLAEDFLKAPNAMLGDLTPASRLRAPRGGI